MFLFDKPSMVFKLDPPWTPNPRMFIAIFPCSTLNSRMAFCLRKPKAGILKLFSVCMVDMSAIKRTVSVSTVEKWIAESDASINTIMWLGFDRLTGNRECVASLKCKIWILYKERLVSCRNYNTDFIEGSSNLRISAVKDHSRSGMHARAMMLFSKSQEKPVTEYAPVAKALNFLDAVTEQSRVEKKVGIAYLI